MWLQARSVCRGFIEFLIIMPPVLDILLDINIKFRKSLKTNIVQLSRVLTKNVQLRYKKNVNLTHLISTISLHFEAHYIWGNIINFDDAF